VSTSLSPDSAATPVEPNPRRWLILAVIAIAQLMIVVDASIVNIALPHAQKALHISNANRQWVITAYTLAFGGLLLLGGRIADYVGRKRMLLIGLLGFAAASALGGLAPDAAVLFSARAIQGAFAAVMAPSALALLNVTFTDAKERARAFGVYGAIAGGGLAIGLIGGGILTQFASWRWCLLVNTPIAIFAAIATYRLVSESKGTSRGRYDLPGALTSTVGLVSLVYGVTEAETKGWESPITILLLGAAVVLLAAFVVIERSTSHPLLPLRVVTERNRGGAFLASALVGLALFGTFLFLTYYLQGKTTLDYSPLRTGFAFLPFSVGIVISATVASSLMTRFAPRWLMTTGLVMAALGMLWFTQLGAHSGFWPHVFPAEVVMSLGMGLVFVPISSTALVGVAGRDSGVASAMINTTQQVGGSIGVALLNTVAASATTSYVAAHGAASLVKGLVHGYATAYLAGAGFMVLAIVLTLVLINAKREDLEAVTASATEEALAF
jgi:EmrB/QacA subfamily drug resistance transporter